MKKNISLILLFLMIIFCCNIVYANDGGGGGTTNSVENRAEEGNSESSKKETRFEKIGEDISFIYLLDKKDSGWVRRPFTANQYVISAWVKMLPYEYVSNEVLYNPTEERTYYLVHYLIDPSSRKIQFLCEVEVTGRPENNIKQRKYNPNDWEDLVPESVEDTIYHAVVKKYGKSKGSNSLTDIIEDVFHIAIT